MSWLEPNRAIVPLWEEVRECISGTILIKLLWFRQELVIYCLRCFTSLLHLPSPPLAIFTWAQWDQLQGEEGPLLPPAERTVEQWCSGLQRAVEEIWGRFPPSLPPFFLLPFLFDWLQVTTQSVSPNCPSSQCTNVNMWIFKTFSFCNNLKFIEKSSWVTSHLASPISTVLLPLFCFCNFSFILYS
jgi:hypothetical protein